MLQTRQNSTLTKWRNCSESSFKFEPILFDQPLVFCFFAIILIFSNYWTFVMKKFKDSLGQASLTLIILLNDDTVKYFNAYLTTMVLTFRFQTRIISITDLFPNSY